MWELSYEGSGEPGNDGREGVPPGVCPQHVRVHGAYMSRYVPVLSVASAWARPPCPSSVCLCMLPTYAIEDLRALTEIHKI